MTIRRIVGLASAPLLIVAVILLSRESGVAAPVSVRTITEGSGEVSDAIRTAMLGGEAVEIVRHEAVPLDSVAGADVSQADVVSKQRYDNRQLTSAEQAKALRMVGRLLEAASSPFSLDGKSEVEQEVHIAQKLKDRALLSAVQVGIAEGSCFLTRGIIIELRNDSRWHYWNIDFPMRDGERRWMETLYVPIDLVRFPEVVDRKARLATIRDYQRADAAYVWNSKSFEERFKLVAQAKEARQEFLRVDGELSATSDPEVKARLGVRLREVLTIMSLVPRKYDPVTLEVRL